MKFRAWYSVEWESQEGEVECEADSPEEARKILEEMAEDEARSPYIDSIALDIKCIEGEQEQQEKIIDPNQADWVDLYKGEL